MIVAVTVLLMAIVVMSIAIGKHHDGRQGGCSSWWMPFTGMIIISYRIVAVTTIAVNEHSGVD